MPVASHHRPGDAVPAGLDVPDAAAFRAAMGRFPTGVTMLTQGSGDATTAMTLNSLVSVSLDPLLVLVSVKGKGRIRPRIVRAGSFAVNLLGQHHQDLALDFARPDRPVGAAAMARLAAVAGGTGNAVMPSATAALECLLHAEVEAGDHVLLIGRVATIHTGDPGTPPLVFHRGGFTRLAHTEELP
ncbi:flavin reductase family protein [Kitasatospora sp. NPDC058218]|uniref:flavin reductase family protein n=1 Tax=Kitasatospora sp. NPDC058218 TaxID=3346385 RepID=UPI0036DD751C